MFDPSPSRNSVTPESFMQMIDPYLRSMTALIRFRVPWRDDWDDVLQNTLLCAWRSLDSLRDKTALKPWLLKICGNCCHMCMRSTIRRNRFTERVTRDFGKSPPPTAMGRSIGEVDLDSQIELERLLKQLPESQRSVLVDYYFKGLCVSEIATRANRPEGTVKRWMHSGRQHLKSLLDDSMEPTEGDHNDQ